MTLKKALKTWMIALGVSTSGRIKLTRVPSGRNAANDQWWLKSEGGLTTHLATGEAHSTHNIGFYYRNEDPQAVDQAMETLAESINTVGCLNLSAYGHDVVRLPVTSSPETDQDLDSEERTIGYLQMQVTTQQT